MSDLGINCPQTLGRGGTRRRIVYQKSSTSIANLVRIEPIVWGKTFLCSLPKYKDAFWVSLQEAIAMPRKTKYREIFQKPQFIAYGPVFFWKKCLILGFISSSLLWEGRSWRKHNLKRAHCPDASNKIWFQSDWDFWRRWFCVHFQKRRRIEPLTGAIAMSSKKWHLDIFQQSPH